VFKVRPKFEYIKGSATTNKPWFRPNPRLLNKWKFDFFNIKGVEKYKYWICGGALEEWKTWDTDIVMTGKIKDYDELENILVTATQLGFKHRQLIDINWTDYESDEQLINTISNDFRELFSKNIDVVDFSNINEKNAKYNFHYVISICSNIVKNGEFIELDSEEKIRLSTSLWKRKQITPSKKQIDRIKKGIIYKNSPILLTRDLDFEEIIR
jgi:hypothetical protein